MKACKIISIALLFAFSITLFEGYAQGPPPWAPAHRYRAKARYTYFPSLNFYFDTKGGFYFFLEAGTWVRRTTLPSKYKNYNWSKYKYEEFDWPNDNCWEKHHGKSKDQGNSSGKSKGKSKEKSKG